MKGLHGANTAPIQRQYSADKKPASAPRAGFGDGCGAGFRGRAGANGGLGAFGDLVQVLEQLIFEGQLFLFLGFNLKL